MSWKPEIRQALDKLMASSEPKKIAVFDADGTLWHDDLGEAFFKYQISKNLAPGLRGVADPWSTYKEKCNIDTAKAFGWLAQINAGLTDEVVHAQSTEFYQHSFKQKVDPHLRELISELKRHQFEIWICTASIKWA